MTTRIRAGLVAACAAVCACAEDGAPAARAQTQSEAATLFAARPDAQWRLPHRLAEISGLALTPDGRVLAHDDEAAVIYEIDGRHGRLVKAFALGDAPLRVDFEGIAVTPDGAVFVTTSTGQLYRFREDEDGARVAYERFDAGLAHVCEIEGLAFDPASGSLILACKTLHGSDMDAALALFAWSPARPNTAAQPWMTVSREALAALGAPPLSASGVELDPASGRVLVLAARERMLVELSREGEPLSARRLGAGHRQAEGIALSPDGALLISDEAGDIERALLTRYGRRT